MKKYGSACFEDEDGQFRVDAGYPFDFSDRNIKITVTKRLSESEIRINAIKEKNAIYKQTILDGLWKECEKEAKQGATV